MARYIARWRTVHEMYIARWTGDHSNRSFVGFVEADGVRFTKFGFGRKIVSADALLGAGRCTLHDVWFREKIVQGDKLWGNPTADLSRAVLETYIHTLIKIGKKWRPRRHSPNQPRTQGV